MLLIRSAREGACSATPQAVRPGDLDGVETAGDLDITVGPLQARAGDLDEDEAVLSDEERRRANRFVLARDRRRFIVARAGLRRLLAARLKRGPDTIELTYGDHGKPALVRRTGDPDVRFNVSHSEDVVMYALAQGRDVGVDIEAIRVIPDADDLAARFFSPGERAAYEALAPHDRTLGFLNGWTRKEAFIKALGTGLSHPLHAFDVSLAPGEPARIIRVDETPGDEAGWHLESFSPVAGFVAAVVAKRAACSPGAPR